MGAIAVQQMADRVASLMEERLRVRGTGLRDKLRRGGHRLPRSVRREAEYLAEVAILAQNPKVEMMLDDARIAQAYDTCLRYLRGKAYKGRVGAFLMDLAGSAVLYIVLAAGLAMALARWRGLI